MHTENVVVDREHVEVLGGRTTASALDGDLRVVNSGEVTGTSWLMLFWLKRKRVRVNTRVWRTRVMLVWLHLVKVLTGLFLESVLTVKDQFERFHVTSIIFKKRSRTSSGFKEWLTILSSLDNNVGRIAIDVHFSHTIVLGQVPHSLWTFGITFGDAPHQFLNWVVVGQSDLLGRTRGNRIGTSVLNLFDQVFMTLLRESSALFSVEVDVVRPDLERRRGQVLVKTSGQVKVNSDFVVLQGNQWQGQSWVSVEEEDEWQEDLLTTGAWDWGSCHLTPVSLGRIGQVQFRVQSPPSLVVFVDSLTTDGQFSGLDRTFRDPVSIVVVTRIIVKDGLSLSRSGRSRQFDIHVADQITVSGDRDGNTTRRSGRTVNSLFDVFHRKVCVAFVNSLEESDFWVTSQVDILGAVGDELHETTGHFVCFVL